jgi:cytochrome P450
MQDHRRLEVYQVAKQLALQVYAVAAQLPVTERFELARQLRRAVVSIGSNVAEWHLAPKVNERPKTARRVQQMLTRLIIKLRRPGP